jgi:TolB-like protein
MTGCLRWLGVAAIAISVLAGARTAGAAPRPTVAVLYFDYSGTDDQLAILRKGLAQMMISDLSAVDAVQLVERDRLEEILAELRLGQSHKIDPASAAKVGKLLGARYLILGGYFDLKSMLRIDARVVEVETGKVVQSVGATGDADSFLALEQKLVADIGAVLGKQLSLPPVKTPPTPKVKPPAKLARRTAMLYSRALHDMDSGDKTKARAELEQVVKEQPDFKLAMVDLDKLLQ